MWCILLSVCCSWALLSHLGLNGHISGEPELATCPVGSDSPPFLQENLLETMVATVSVGLMLLLSPNKQCHSTERNWKELTPASENYLLASCFLDPLLDS